MKLPVNIKKDYFKLWFHFPACSFICLLFFFGGGVIEKRCDLILCWFHEWCTMDKTVHSNADQILYIHVHGTYICKFFLDNLYVTQFGQYTYANIFNYDVHSISLFLFIKLLVCYCIYDSAFEWISIIKPLQTL